MRITIYIQNEIESFERKKKVKKEIEKNIFFSENLYFFLIKDKEFRKNRPN